MDTLQNPGPLPTTTAKNDGKGAGKPVGKPAAKPSGQPEAVAADDAPVPADLIIAARLSLSQASCSACTMQLIAGWQTPALSYRVQRRHSCVAAFCGTNP